MKAKPISVYVGCAITTAPAEYLQYIQKVKKALGQCVKPKFNVLEFILPGENHLGVFTGSKGVRSLPAKGDIFKNDIETCVATCDVFVAFVDHSSSGLGLELGAALWKTPKPILLMAHKDVKFSTLILDLATIYPKRVSVCRYSETTPAEATSLICQHCYKLNLSVD